MVEKKQFFPEIIRSGRGEKLPGGRINVTISNY